MEHPKEKGEKTEAILIAKFVERGFRVLLPFGDSRRYDLVLDTPDGFRRVQCKTGKLINGTVRFPVSSVRTNLRVSRRSDYHGQVDYFAVYCYENSQAYLVPIDLVGVSNASLRVTPAKHAGGNPVLKAEDYKL
jgi:hypothetical protein